MCSRYSVDKNKSHVQCCGRVGRSGNDARSKHFHTHLITEIQYVDNNPMYILEYQFLKQSTMGVITIIIGVEKWLYICYQGHIEPPLTARYALDVT